MMQRSMCVAALAAALAGGTAKAETISGSATPVSGDTIAIEGREVRLRGIDAPERGQMCKNRYGREYDCFERSKQILEMVVRDQTVECTTQGFDAARRPMGLCRASGRDVSAVMVEVGWALAYRTLTLDYVSGEARAQSRRRGLWSGQVEPPWQWRSKKRAPPPEAPTPPAPAAAPAKP